MAKYEKRERTLIILKPDAIQRTLIGEILQRIERTGLKFTAMKLHLPTEDQCWKHYNKDDEWYQKKGERMVNDRKENNLPIEKEAIEYGKDIIRTVVGYITCGPVLVAVVEGHGATTIVKKIVGSTEPVTSDIGTIRGDFTIDSYGLSALDNRAVRNLIHCSENWEEAEKEIPIWFEEKEILSYRLVQEQILYDVNLDGILE